MAPSFNDWGEIRERCSLDESTLHRDNFLRMNLINKDVVIRAGANIINTGTWPSRLGESQMRQKNMAVSSAGLRPKSDCSGKTQKQLYSKLQTRPLVREGATKEQIRNLSKRNFKEKEKLVAGPRWVPDTKTDWPTDCWS
jgi:hypothetical protein